MTLAVDNYTRANQTGLGTASDGVSTYTFRGASQTVISSIVSNAAKFTASTTLTTASIGTKQAADVIVEAEVSLDHTGDHAGVIARYNGTTTYYRCEIDSGTTVSISKIVAGVGTDLATGSFTYATTDQVWIKFYVHGTTLECKVWNATGSEPGSMTLSTTDSSISAAGYVGLKVLLHTTADVVHFYSLSGTEYYVNTLAGIAQGQFVTQFTKLQPRTRSTFSTVHGWEVQTHSHFLVGGGGNLSTRTIYVPGILGVTIIQYSTTGTALETTSQITFSIGLVPRVSDSFIGVDGVDTFVQMLG